MRSCRDRDKSRLERLLSVSPPVWHHTSESCSVRAEGNSEGSGPSLAVASSGIAMPSPSSPSMKDSLDWGIRIGACPRNSSE